ncbi:MAG: hypothetical protein KDD82_09915 [Planctomycetes bacterium]|nr:hypothetical protein [Planctomycetota bacterium]
MNAELQALFDPTDPGARRRGLAGLLAQADAPALLERALLDLLDLEDPGLLAAVASGLSPRAGDPPARRVLEALSRAQGGPEVRGAALRALRGELRELERAGPSPSAEHPSLAAFARAAASPTPEALDDAELALIEVDPSTLDPAQRDALAQRLEQAAGAHPDAASRTRLERLARELRDAG